MPTPDVPHGSDDRLLALQALLIAGEALGGVVLKGQPGPAREAWLARLAQHLPAHTPVRTLPAHIDDHRLLGGLDLSATLAAGHAVVQPGLLAQAHGGVIRIPVAERLDAGRVARLCTVLDRGEVEVQRDGVSQRYAARCTLVALDEGLEDDEQVAPALADRLALHVRLDTSSRPLDASDESAQRLATARATWAHVQVPEAAFEALCNACVLLGIDSLRTPWQAVVVARALAAWAGRACVSDEDLAGAARLVLAPRATRSPPPPPPQDEAQASPPERSQEAPHEDERDPSTNAPGDQPLEDRLVEAAQAALPPDVLALLQAGMGARMRPAGAGRSGQVAEHAARGRRIGQRRGTPSDRARLDLLATLRAAAPWQVLRRRERQGTAAPRLELRRDDFRIARHQQHRPTTIVFVLDASGSSALHRLAEAKGAIELLLGDCYARRDRVAVLAFRHRAAELLLPPTRSLARAKRCLGHLPGGGGTPLSLALDETAELVRRLLRQGDSPTVVLLTDGRANVCRDGRPGHAAAQAEAQEAARTLQALPVAALLIDTSPPARAGPGAPASPALALAQAMGARYLPLPQARAQEVCAAVRLTAAARA
jgi:magnesium chelatase subunit D